MKRVALVLLFLTLLLTEAYLASAFLPKAWQMAIQRVLPWGHDNSHTTHPDLEGEIDQVLSHHVALRVLFYTVLVLFLAGNALLLIIVWKSLRRMSKASADPLGVG